MKDKTTKTEKDWVFNLAYNKALADVEKEFRKWICKDVDSIKAKEEPVGKFILKLKEMKK